MYEVNFNPNHNPCTYPRNWSLDELEARAGALVNEALENWSSGVKSTHWEDMKQTAMLVLLTHQDKVASYGYAAARAALKNYKWVHIRGLNGGWKSLVARNYTVSDAPLEIDGDRFERPRSNLYHWSLQTRQWDLVARPVEWKVMAWIDGSKAMTTEDIRREILYILAGMSRTNWYPEQIYRAAVIISMLFTNYTWEDVEEYTGMDYSEVADIWWHHRKTRLAPYIELPLVHREIVRLLGQTRLTYFEELSHDWLNQPKRKMVVLPDGIYTITYKRRGRRPGQTVGQMEASLQKGRRINGRPVVRAVSLGKVGSITKEKLLESSLQLERKLERLCFVQQT